MDKSKFQSYWRPLIAYQYILVCIFDYIIFPLVVILIRAFSETHYEIQTWVPLTLREGGLYHLSMGAILGVAAWTRGQEKIAAANTSSQDSAKVE